MPYGFRPAEVFIEHKEVKIYHTYPNNQVDQKPNCFKFGTTENSNEEDDDGTTFDVRGLSTFHEPPRPKDLPHDKSDPTYNEIGQAWMEYFEEVKVKSQLAIKESIEKGELTADGVVQIFCYGGPRHGQLIPVPDDDEFEGYIIAAIPSGAIGAIFTEDMQDLLVLWASTSQSDSEALHQAKAQMPEKSFISFWDPPLGKSGAVMLCTGSDMQRCLARGKQLANQKRLDVNNVNVVELP